MNGSGEAQQSWHSGLPWKVWGRCSYRNARNFASLKKLRGPLEKGRGLMTVHGRIADMRPVSRGGRIDPNVWSGRASQEVSSSWRCTVLHQCIRPWIGARSAPGHHGYQRACDLISGQASMGQMGHQCSHAPGRPILHLVFILSQTSAGKRYRSMIRQAAQRPR